MQVISFAACFSAAFWVMCAIVAQMLLKGTFLIFNSAWEYMFYYDSIGMVFIVLIVVTAYQRIKAFIKKDAEITEQYDKFYSAVSVAFTLFYIVVLVYCFFICRIPGGNFWGDLIYGLKPSVQIKRLNGCVSSCRSKEALSQ